MSARLNGGRCNSLLLASLLLFAGACADRSHVEETGHASGAPRTDETGRIIIELEDLGLRDAQRFNALPTLTFPFVTRSDQVLTAVTLHLQFADLVDPKWGVLELEVLMNQERMATLGIDQLRGNARSAVIAIDPKALGDKNQLTLRVRVTSEKKCGTIDAEVWNLIKGGQLILQAAPLPLPNEIANLPLPFVDRGFDHDVAIRMVLPSPTSLAHVRLAGLVASWFGIDSGVEASYPISSGKLPDASAVVFIDGPETARGLGLPVPTTASIEVMDHPAHPGSNVKLLVISGQNLGELERAVENLVAGWAGRFKGSRAEFSETPPIQSYQPYSSPRWLPGGRDVQLAHLASPAQLLHEGLVGGHIAAHFRIPPDMWVWPDEFIELDIGYGISVPPGIPQPRLDAMLNGTFLSTLPPVDVLHGETTQRTVLRVHRSSLRGFNELVVFVNYADAETLCSAGDAAEFRAQLLPDTTFRLAGARHFARLPNLRLFVHDGFPFTRMPDLSETAVVLPDDPKPEDIGMLLSTLNHLAMVTGVVGRPALLTFEQLLTPSQAPRDLLLIGSLSSNTMVRRWAGHMSVLTGDGPARVQAPSSFSPMLDLMAAGRGSAELQRAVQMAAGASRLATVNGFESPLWPGRTVVAIGASTSADLPSFDELTGFAESFREGGDALVLINGRRGIFHIGEGYSLGHLKRFDRLRWFLAEHPLLLVPCLFIGVIGLALLLARIVRNVQEARLAIGTVAPEPEP